MALLPPRWRPGAEHGLGRDFNWLILSSTVSQLGSVSALAAFPLLALTVTGSPVLAGWVTVVGTLLPLLLQLPAGVLVERSNYRLIMLASQVVRVASALMLLSAFLLFDKPVAALLVAAALEGMCAVFYGTAELTSVPRIVQHQLLPVAIARNEARSQGALLLGRPLGGFLVAAGSFAPSLITLVAGTAALLSVRRIDRGLLRADTIDDAGMFKALKRGLSAFWRTRFLRATMFVCIVTNVLFQIVILLFIVQAKHDHRSAFFIGLILAVSGLGGLIGAITARWLIAGVRRLSVLVFCCGAWLILTGVIAYSHDSFAMVAAWGGIGFVGANVNVTLNLFQARAFKRQFLARVTSASNFISRSSAAAGAVCAGYIVSAYGPAHSAVIVFWAMLGLTVAVFICAAFIALARRRHQPTSDPDPGADDLVRDPSPVPSPEPAAAL